MKDEALDKALDALEDLQRQYSIYPNSFWDWSKGRKAIATIQQALAAPTVQEPCAWCVDSENSADWAIAKTKEGVNFNAKLMDAECIKTAPFALYTTPPAAQPAVQEPVAWIDLLKKAEEVVRSKPLWKKYIDGTPLANDIAVWMAKFAQENTAAQPAPVQPDYKQLYEQVCEQYDVLAKELEATKQALAAPTVQELGARVDAVVAKIKSGISEKPTALNSYGLKIWGTVRDDLLALASPPAAQRLKSWVGLTDEDYVNIGMSPSLISWQYKAIEAKLKEKNT